MPTPPKNLREFSSLIKVVEDLRGPQGCPWDKEQTPTSLAPFAIEEVYELVSAIEEGDLESAAGWLAECLRVPTERLDGDLGVEIDCADGLLSLTHDGDYTLIRDPGCPDARTPWRDRTTGACLAEELRRLDPDETYARALRGTKRLQHTTR